MRFLHISDLHLGKRVNEFSMVEDQKYILNQITELAKSVNIDAVFIAGDIYDKNVPAAEAVEVFDRFITGLSDTGIKIYAVSGNHDSAQRVAFGSRIMAHGGVYFSQVYDGKIEKHVFSDKYGKVNIYMLPFIKPSNVKRFYEDREINDCNCAVKTALESLCLDKNERNVIIAHQFVAGAITSDSEEISVGGLDNVDISVFKDFDYVALGHIHGPQNLGTNARYCGTPLKYSISEADHKKSATVVELGPKGDINIQTIPFKPLRDMREIKGSYEYITGRKNYEGTNTDDYIHITLTDENETVDAIGKLRSIYPNIMRLDYDNIRTRKNADVIYSSDTVNKGAMELFAEFFNIQNNMPMTDEQEAEAKRFWEETEEEFK